MCILKKTILLILATLTPFSLTSCATAPPYNTEVPGNSEVSSPSETQFTMLDNGNIVAPDGTEYVHFVNEGFVTAFGSRTFLGKIKDENSSSFHEDIGWETGMYACENDPDLRTLIRIVPDNEWAAYYRKVSLPELDLSVDNCIRFELIGYKEINSGEWFNPGIEHMSCNDGIVDQDEMQTFLADVRSQKSPDDAGLYDLDGFNDDDDPDDDAEYISYLYGTVYGYFEDEPNLAIPLNVESYNDKAYSIRLDNENDEYVLPEKWLSALTKKYDSLQDKDGIVPPTDSLDVPPVPQPPSKNDSISVDFCYELDYIDGEFILTYETVDISRKDMLKDANYYMIKRNDLKIDNLWYEGKKIVIDFNEREFWKFNSGSTGGILWTAIIHRTFSSFPDVEEIEFLLDGKRKSQSDHYNFDRIFSPVTDDDLSDGYIKIQPLE